MADLYSKGLAKVPNLELQIEKHWTKSVFWMYALRVMKGSKVSKDQLRKRLYKLGIDTRDLFYPLHKQPALRKLGLFKNEKYPVSTDLSERGFYIPSGLALSERQIIKVIDAVKKAVS